MPGTLVLIKFLVDDLSETAGKYSGTEWFLKGTSVVTVAVFIYVHFLISYGYFSSKTVQVGWGGDTIMGYDPALHPQSFVFQVAIETLKADMKENDSLAVFPIGIMLNYMVRKKQPIRGASLDPFSQRLLGEDYFLTKMRQSPPSFIAIVYHDFLEYSDRFFGKDFGIKTTEWIKQNYISHKIIRADPLYQRKYGIHIFKRKNPAMDIGREEANVGCGLKKQCRFV